MDLEKTRKEIDTIDKELLKLFQDRLQKVLTIAKIKEETGKSIFDPAREKIVLEKALAQINDDEFKPYVTSFVHAVMDICKDCQKDHIQQSIFLIGMPGAGKTTVGRALARREGMEFFDLDALIQEKTKKSIQNIIIHDGEEAFRQYEYEALKDIVETKGASVVATGGGTILSEKSSELMRDHGLVVFLHRDVTQILDDLDMEIRPLLKESIEYIFRLYEERYPLYEKVSHVKVLNAGTVEDAVDQIAAALPPVFR